MNRILIVFLFLLVSTANAQSDQKVIIQEPLADYLLVDFLTQLEQEYSFNFYYREKWIQDLRIELESGEYGMEELFGQVFLPVNISWYISPAGTVFLMPFGQNISQLQPKLQESNQQAVRDLYEDNYLRGRNANAKITIEVGEANGVLRRGATVRVEGHVSSSVDGEPLIGATIFIKESGKGAASNSLGKLVLNIQPGSYDVVFQCMGMKDLNATLQVHSAGSFALQMEESTMAIDEVLVRQQSLRRGSKGGMESVDFLTMKEIPALMGEKDVMKIAQMLPGIVSVSEGSGGVNVRGGNADQNLFYINNIPVYNSAHLFGFFSSVNANIVENFTVYKGQVPVNYGGRLSSVFELQTRPGNKQEFFTSGGVSPVSANVAIEAPLVKDKASLVMSARSSYSNWLLKRLEDPELRNSKASFYDFTGGIDYDINNRQHLNLLVYGSNDHFNLNELSAYNYGNLGAALRYDHRYSERIKATAQAIVSNYSYQTIDQRAVSAAYQHRYNIGHYEARAELDWTPVRSHQVKAGINSVFYLLNRGNVEAYGDESFKAMVALGEERGLESALFLADQIQFGSRFSLYAGLRYSLFTALGPGTMRQYLPGAERSDANVSELITYNRRETMASYHAPEIRLAADFKLTPEGTVKATFTQMQQYLFMLSNTISITPTDQWKLADGHIRPQSSDQLSLGYYHDAHETGFLASAEVYYKQADDLVEYRDGADFLSTPFAETTVLQGDQEAYGAEFMISRDQGKLNGWLSYTYSRSLITINGKEDWEKINQGLTYASNYDKPHVVNLVLNWKINRRISLSGNMVYNTGRPVTLPVGFYYLEGRPYVDYSLRNEFRIPDYFRTDFSVKVEGNLRKNKALHSYWMFSVYNATGRDNVNSVFFQSDNGIIKGYQYSVVGVPIYTISWNWKLGNYANN